MSAKKRGTRRFKPSHTYAIISTSLVLFTFGILCLIFIHGRKLTNYVKESIAFSVILKDNTSNQEAVEFQKQLNTSVFVKSSEYISKDEAAKKYIEEYGDNFQDLLDANPLYASIEVKLNAAYANPDSVIKIESIVKQNPAVSEFYYEKKFVDLTNNNFKTISMIVIILSFFFGLVAYMMIDSTIRLVMYSQRFLLRSMQLVGATKSFITKPFLITAVRDGFISGIIAVAALSMLLNLLLNLIPELRILQDMNLTFLLFGLVACMGILFSLISTFFAVRKYLRLKLDELY